MSKAQHSQSHLFMVRVWQEDLGEGKIEWRGQVKNVMSGEVRYFRNWEVLVVCLNVMLSSAEASRQDSSTDCEEKLDRR